MTNEFKVDFDDAEALVWITLAEAQIMLHADFVRDAQTGTYRYLFSVDTDELWWVYPKYGAPHIYVWQSAKASHHSGNQTQAHLIQGTLIREVSTVTRVLNGT